MTTKRSAASVGMILLFLPMLVALPASAMCVGSVGPLGLLELPPAEGCGCTEPAAPAGPAPPVLPAAPLLLGAGQNGTIPFSVDEPVNFTIDIAASGPPLSWEPQRSDLHMQRLDATGGIAADVPLEAEQETAGSAHQLSGYLRSEGTYRFHIDLDPARAGEPATARAHFWFDTWEREDEPDSTYPNEADAYSLYYEPVAYTPPIAQGWDENTGLGNISAGIPFDVLVTIDRPVRFLGSWDFISVLDPSFSLEGFDFTLVRTGANGSAPTEVPLREVPAYSKLLDYSISQRIGFAVSGDVGEYVLTIEAPTEGITPGAIARLSVSAPPPRGPAIACASGGTTQVRLLPNGMAALALGTLAAVLGYLGATENGRYGAHRLRRRLRPGSEAGVLDNFTRGRIYGYIQANPGASISELRRQMAISNGTAIHHLELLEGEGLVLSQRDGVRRRFYPPVTGSSVPTLRTLSLTQGLILDLVRDHPGIGQREIATRARASSQVVSYHLRNLEDGGLVRAEFVRGAKRLWLRPERVRPNADGSYQLADGTVLTRQLASEGATT